MEALRQSRRPFQAGLRLRQFRFEMDRSPNSDKYAGKMMMSESVAKAARSARGV
jgi:hypothetical protein